MKINIPIYQFFILSFFHLFIFSEAYAQSYQRLSILGKEATTANAADILGDGGSVSYDAATKTLTLRNANLPCDPYSPAIESVYALKTIRLVGKNQLRNHVELRQAADEDIIITGTANTDCLAIDSKTNSIVLYGQNLFDDTPYFYPNITFSHCYVTLTASLTGDLGLWGAGSDKRNRIIMQNAYLSAQTINKIDRIVTSHKAGVTYPEGAYFDKKLHAVTLDGKTAHFGTVIIDDRDNAKALNHNCFSLRQKDGMVINYSFSEKPVVTYSGSDLVMTTSSLTVQYPLHTLQKLIFVGEADTPDGIDQATLPGTEFSFSEEGTTVSGEKPGTPFYVFDTRGMQLHQGTIDANGKADIRMTNLPKGIYVIKTQSTSFKIKK